MPEAIPPSKATPGSVVGKNRLDTVRSISSDELMAGRRMIVIRHGRDIYRLQITGAGKLILTK